MRHNLFSPSSAHIWRHCLSSKLLTPSEWRLPSVEEARIKGQKLHDEIAAYLKNNIPLVSDLAKKAVEVYKNKLKEKGWCAPPRVPLFKYRYSKNPEFGWYCCEYEKYFPLSVISGHKRIDVGGTPDIVIVTNKTLNIFDFKFGVAEKINAVFNPQLILYAHAVYYSYLGGLTDVQFNYYIIQPTLDHFSEYEQVNLDTQIMLYNEITAKIKNFDLHDTIENLGLHCKYCPAKLNCKKFKKVVEKAANY